MKKYYLVVVLFVACSLNFVSCGPSPLESATSTSETFWRVLDANRNDSVEILYPEFNKLGVRLSQIQISRYEAKDVIERENMSFEARTNVYFRGTKDPILCSLFIHEVDGKWIVYDSRNLAVHSTKDLRLLKQFHDVGNGDITFELTDQERCFAIDSVIYTIKQNIIDSINNIIAHSVPARIDLNGNPRLINKSSYDLSNARIYLKYKSSSRQSYNPWHWYLWESFAPGRERYVETWEQCASGSKVYVKLSDEDAWKFYRPTGNEYREYMQSINK